MRHADCLCLLYWKTISLLFRNCKWNVFDSLCFECFGFCSFIAPYLSVYATLQVFELLLLSHSFLFWSIFILYINHRCSSSCSPPCSSQRLFRTRPFLSSHFSYLIFLFSLLSNYLDSVIYGCFPQMRSICYLYGHFLHLRFLQELCAQHLPRVKFSPVGIQTRCTLAMKLVSLGWEVRFRSRILDWNLQC